MSVDDVVARAKAALEAHECADCDESPCGWERYDQGERCLAIVPELVAEVERLRTELAFARDGMEIRPMTAVESNLMTQVLNLRRQLAVAGVHIEEQP